MSGQDEVTTGWVDSENNASSEKSRLRKKQYVCEFISASDSS